LMQIPGGMDLLHGSVAVLSGVGGFDKITVHLTSRSKRMSRVRIIYPSLICFQVEVSMFQDRIPDSIPKVTVILLVGHSAAYAEETALTVASIISAL
jgi:hypothetical protein